MTEGNGGTPQPPKRTIPLDVDRLLADLEAARENAAAKLDRYERAKVNHQEAQARLDRAQALIDFVNRYAAENGGLDG